MDDTELDAYLKPTPWIDFDSPEVQAHLATHPADGRPEEAIIRDTFKFVRDRIAHSWDIGSRRLIGPASEALRFCEGICYAEAQLLAALLRGQGIPSGLCYHRLTLGDTTESGHCLHALNTVYVHSQHK